MMTRSKVREALKALRQTYSARSSRGVRLIEVLLEEEEEAWIRRNDPGGSSSAVVHREVNLVSLARRLVDTTREVELLQDGTEIVPPPSTPKSTDDSFLPALTNWSGEAPPFPSRCPSAKLPQVEQHCVGAEQRQQLVNYQQEQLQEQQQQEQQQQVQSQAQQQPGDHPPTYSSATAHQVTNQDASIVADLSLDEMWNWLIAQSATYGL